MTGARQAGFSLLELLVTLFVIVLVTSLVSLTVSSGGRDIELEAKVRNLADVGAYAVDEAQLLERDYGLLLQREQARDGAFFRYEWRERSRDGWHAPTTGKEVFAAQELPPGVELELSLEDAPVDAITLAAAADEDEPQVVFYASGETTAGAIAVRDSKGELLWRLEWDLLGRFRVLPRGEEPEDARE